MLPRTEAKNQIGTNAEPIRDNSELFRRGTHESALHAGWRFIGAGWEIPVHDLNGDVLTHRFKNANSKSKKKYSWMPSKGSAKYYYPDHKKFLAAIEKAGGAAWIANGEPAGLAFVAAGMSNVFSWFGETSVPDTLADDLAGWGVKTVYYPADNDKTGRKSAAKVRDLLAGSGIDFYPLAWGDVPEKYDANDLWIDCGFDAGEFAARLAGLEALILPREIQKPTPITSYHPDDETPPDLVSTIASQLGVSTQPNRNGFARKNVKCLFHDDHNPSASLKLVSDENGKAGGMHCHTCGCWYPYTAVAEALGIDWKRSYPERSFRSDHKHSKRRPFGDPATEGQYYIGDNLQADVTGAATYICDLPIPDGDVAIKSDTGTGKTTWAAGQRIRTTITHRVALSEALADALGTECYKDLTPDQQRQASKLTTCINSIHNIPDRIPGVLFIDEIRQVIAHLGGDTLKGAQAETAFNTLEAQIKRAKRVIVADADLDDIIIDWLKSLRPDLKVVENTQPRQRGPLTVYKHKGGLIAKVWQLVDENAGPVVVPTGSKKQAKDLEAVAVDRYGEHAVMTVHQDVSNEPDVKYFLSNINSQISQYRVVIYSPTMGSGIDIQTPVRAVCGLFLAEPLTPSECHQMLNRCRNAQETHVYIEVKDGKRETDPDVIYQNAVDNAIQTGLVAHFDDHGVQVITPAQERLHRLLSKIEAADNASKNQLFDHFMQLARGYSSTTYDETDNRAAHQATIEQRQAREEAEKNRTLTATPVDRFEYETLRESGKLTQDDRFGHLRWKIDRAAGQDITEVNYDLLHTPAGRGKLYGLVDLLHEPFDVLAELDRLEADALPGKRKHRARRATLLNDLIKRLFGRDGLTADRVFEASEINEVVNDFMAVAGDEVQRLFNRRADLSKEPVPFLRWMLGQLGIRLESKRRGKGDNRRRVYFLNPETLETMLALAKTSYARRVADRSASEKQDTGTQNVYGTKPPTRVSGNPTPDLPPEPAPSLPLLDILTRPTLLTPARAR